MLNIPALKFEKSIKYLENELTIQNSNRELLLDVIANINLISKNSTKEEKDHLDAVLFEANDLLSQSSNMISDLEHLKLEIESITKELNNVLGDKNLKTRTKEYFIATFSDIKKKITIYTVKFKDVETNLKVQNERVNNFIKANNLQYNYDSSEGIQFADFSMDGKNATYSNVENAKENPAEVVEKDVVEETVENNVVEEAAEETIANDVENTEEVQEVEKVEVTDLSNEQSDAINNLTSEFKTLLTEVAKGNITEDVTPIIMSYFKQIDNSATEEADSNVEVQEAEEVNEESVSDEEVINENYFNTNIIDELRNMITTGISNIERDIEKRTSTNTNSIENISEDFVDASTDTTSQEVNNTEFMNEIISENEDVENEIAVEDEVSEDITDDGLVEEVQDVQETEEVNEESVSNEEVQNVEENDDFVIEQESVDTVEPVISYADEENDVEENDVEENIDEDITDDYDLPTFNDNYMIQINKDVPRNIFSFDVMNMYQPNSEVVEYSDVIDTPVEVVNVGTEHIEEAAEEVSTSEEIDEDSLLDAIAESEDAESLIDEVVTDNAEESTETVQDSDVIPFEEEPSAEIKIDFYQRSDIDDLSEKIDKIKLAKADNESLIISKEHGIILPYKLTELKEYMDSYPGLYKSFSDVVQQEFILPYNYFSANEKKCRFDEAYNLMKNKEGASAIASYKFAKAISKENDLHPAIIAACRNQRELDAYLYYMQEGELEKFKYFNIYYKE